MHVKFAANVAPLVVEVDDYEGEGGGMVSGGIGGQMKMLLIKHNRPFGLLADTSSFAIVPKTPEDKELMETERVQWRATTPKREQAAASAGHPSRCSQGAVVWARIYKIIKGRD